MAKVQGKKTAVAKRAASRPAAARPKTAAEKKSAKKPVAPKARAAKTTKPAPKAAAKPVAKAKAAAKTALKAVKAVAAKAVKPAPAPAKPAPAKAAAAPAKAAAAPAPKPVAPKVAEKPQQPKAAPKPITISAPKPAASSADAKRARRPRTRVTSNGGPVANWLQTGEKPRPSSFMPAPPRAEAPSLVAAPPASSDRLIRNEDLIAPAVRTVPVRVDVEAAGGRVFIYPNPAEVSLKPGEGIEWDFRYLGGADVTVDEVIIEFDKPSPFPQQVFRCKKPGIGRPQRQLSGGAVQAASGRRVQYTIRAMTAFKTELGAAKTFVTIS